jgi:hypothetical protein
LVIAATQMSSHFSSTATLASTIWSVSFSKAARRKSRSLSSTATLASAAWSASFWMAARRTSPPPPAAMIKRTRKA